MAQRDRRPRRGGREGGLSRHAEWPRAARAGSHPVADDIAAPFLRAPERYRFYSRGNAAKTAGNEKTPMLDRTEDVSIAAKNWLVQFENAIAKPDGPELRDLFHPESYCRDVLALSWHLQTINGADAILDELKTHAISAAPRGFAIDPDRAAPRR